VLETIHIGMSGLLGYSRGLRVIANNTANMNTPGFKSSSLQFSDLFYTGGNLAGGPASRRPEQRGFGLDTAGTAMSFAQGDLRKTGNDLDMAIDGQGLFVLRAADGSLSYTRAGQFEFDSQGLLVNRGDGAKVMGLDAQGQLMPVGFAGRTIHPGRATSRASFSGNLSSTAAERTVSGIKVLDTAGGTHTLSLRLTNLGATAPGQWNVDVLDGSTLVGNGRIGFVDGKPQPGMSQLTFSYAPEGQAPMPLMLDFGTNVTSFAAGDLSTLGVASQDGVGAGTLGAASFDATGTLVLRYSNGQELQGDRLALARFDTPDAVGAKGSNQFEILDERAWHTGTAGDGGFGSVRSGMLEISNVDLSREFSDLVVMQRGYQASSQIISTANEMIQQLFTMKGR